MKKMFYASTCAVLICAFSCNKDPHHNDILGKRITIDTTLASGNLYTLDLKTYGDADDVATITKQASAFTTSEIINPATGFAPVYNFSANGDIKNPVNEQVVLSITEGGNRRRQGCDSTVITINFKVQ
jgi:hypothetical protein